MTNLDHTALPAGTNVRILLQNCQCVDEYMNRAEVVSPLIRQAVRDVDLTDLEEVSYSFDGFGYTLALILAESHIVIHTWPENEYLVLVEISVCDFHRSNRERAIELGNRIASIFKSDKKMVETSSMIPRFSDSMSVSSGYGIYLEIESLLASRKSAFQELVVGKSKAFGRFLALDGVLQTSEGDDAFYHEPLVHVPMLSHPDPKHVLICGGGDGGAAKEVLKHPSVDRCTLVEIDSEVVEISKAMLPSIHEGVFKDPRLSIRIEDAMKYIKATEQEYDIIIMDTTDPIGCAEVLFTEEFYCEAQRHLHTDGLMTLHVGAPLSTETLSMQAIEQLNAVFDHIRPFLHFVPSYSSMMGFMLCAQNDIELPSPDVVGQRLSERGIDQLQIITPQTFHAMFAIPPRFKSLLPELVTASH